MKRRYKKFLLDSYSHYTKYTKKRKFKFDIYQKVAYMFFDYMAKELLDNGSFQLPRKFGRFEIFGFKPRTSNGETLYRFDFNSTKKVNENSEQFIPVYLTNDHTNGYVYRIDWNCANYIVKNKKYFRFRPAKTLKRTLAKLLKEGKEYEIR